MNKLQSEVCYHVEIDAGSEADFGAEKVAILEWILKEPHQVARMLRTSQWDDNNQSNENELIIEIGPRSAS